MIWLYISVNLTELTVCMEYGIVKFLICHDYFWGLATVLLACASLNSLFIHVLNHQMDCHNFVPAQKGCL